MFKHPFPFDPTYGYDLAALRRFLPPSDEPADFADFWRGTYTEALAVQPKPEFRPSAQQVPGFDVFDLNYTSLGGVRIGGWLMTPCGRPATRGLVISHGYGGRDEADTLPLLPDVAMIFPCARGMSRSHQPDIPDENHGHVIHGIESRETYVHRGCAADVWVAASVLLAHTPAAARRLAYVGGSFGGGIGALALPWDPRFTRAYLGVPSFGPHPLRLTLPCIGRGEVVRQYYQTHPEIVDVLRYFDACTAARHLRIPTLVVPALFDPAVPPPGQFAIYNAIPGPKELHVRQAGHFDHAGTPAEDAAERAALSRFLAA